MELIERPTYISYALFFSKWRIRRISQQHRRRFISISALSFSPLPYPSLPLSCFPFPLLPSCPFPETRPPDAFWYIFEVKNNIFRGIKTQTNLYSLKKVKQKDRHNFTCLYTGHIKKIKFLSSVGV